MAFMDFLGQGIGGNTPINQQTTVAGTAGQPIGPTWGQALQAGMRYGSTPGSSTPQLASAIPALQPTPLMQTPQEKQAAQGGDSDDLMAILGTLIKLFGV